MKRGKDYDKIMGPMFPRLHVNDTERGGPRAPPRNKMALYEQLTVPSQRYTIGAVLFNPNNNSSLVSSTSTNQEMVCERGMYFPPYQSPLAPSYNELQVGQPEAVSLTNEPTQVENRKNPIEEDDFIVPIFSQPEVAQCNDKTQSSGSGERHTQLSSNHPMLLLSKQTNKSNSGDLISRQHVINRDGRNLRESDILTREKDGGTPSEDTFGQREYHEMERLSSLEKVDALESTRNDVSLRWKYNPCIGCRYEDSHEDKEMPRIEDDHLLERGNMDRGNDVSETSVVDSVSEMDTSIDDVVGVLGKKHFWKARTAIVNQQRVFAVQVFELHRLIKVQKLIAESPNLLLEASAFVGNSVKDSTLKKYSSDYGVKARVQTVKQKDNSQKPTHKLEGTAENAIAKVPIPGNPSFSANPGSLSHVNMDPKMSPWNLQQPAVHQWLVPVMSPSEGLVYKPYPAPGPTNPMCRGYGPPGPTPLVGNLMSMPYGIPNPHYHPGIGVPMPPAIHFGAQGYFPPYAMPTMSTSISGSAVDQLNQFSGPDPYGQPTADVSLNRNLQHQRSCNMTSQKNGTAAVAVPPKEGSTASSANERAWEDLVLFPTDSTNEISEGAPPTKKPTRVIRVVPHNPKLTRESAARIFHSIQAERQQYESNEVV